MSTADGSATPDGRQAGPPAAAGPTPAAGPSRPAARPARSPSPERPQPVAVVWSERERRPVAFVWRRRRYQVERVLETWVIETGWWREDGMVSRSCWRLRAGGRVVDLRYDRLGKTWALERVLS